MERSKDTFTNTAQLWKYAVTEPDIGDPTQCDPESCKDRELWTCIEDVLYFSLGWAGSE